MLLVSIGLIQANYVRMVPNPKVPHDFPSVSIEMSETVSDQTTIDALKTIEKIILDVDQETIDEFGLQKYIHFNHKSIAARWDSSSATWTVDIQTSDGSSKTVTCSAWAGATCGPIITATIRTQRRRLNMCRP